MKICVVRNIARVMNKNMINQSDGIASTFAVVAVVSECNVVAASKDVSPKISVSKRELVGILERPTTEVIDLV